MKKIISTILALMLLLCAFASCNPTDPSETTKPSGGSSDDDVPALTFDFMSEDLTPYIVLGAYKGHTVEVDPVKYLTDEEFDRQLIYELVNYGAYTENVDRAATETDIVNISYVGYNKDGEKFEGGTGDAEYVTLYNDGGFIEGFTSGIIGAMPKTEVDVNVTFPEDYHSEELAGQPAVFKITVNYIYEPKELTDALIEELSNGEMKTAQEFIDEARKLMKEDADKAYENAKLAAIWDAITKAATQLALPEKAVDEYYNYTISYYQQYANQMLLTLDDFLAKNGITRDDIKKLAEEDVFHDMVIYSVIRAEGITLTDEEYEKERKAFAESAEMTEEYLLKVYTETELRNMFIYTKGYDAALEWNTCVDKAIQDK